MSTYISLITQVANNQVCAEENKIITTEINAEEERKTAIHMIAIAIYVNLHTAYHTNPPQEDIWEI
jgi:uncharacterized protein YcnI